MSFRAFLLMALTSVWRQADLGLQIHPRYPNIPPGTRTKLWAEWDGKPVTCRWGSAWSRDGRRPPNASG
jgi:hypothetical protein